MKKIIKTFFNKFGLDIVRYSKPSDHLKQADHTLFTISEILDRHHVEWWLTCGTLLGFYRDSNYIKHDIDIDLCVDWETFSKECLLEILTVFNLNKFYGLPESSLEICLEDKGLNLDLFFIYKNQSKIYHSVFGDFTNDSYSRFDYVYDPIKLKRTEFRGIRCWVPDDTEYFIQQNYGLNWRVPEKSWHYIKSPPHCQDAQMRITYQCAKEKLLKWINSKNA